MLADMRRSKHTMAASLILLALAGCSEPEATRSSAPSRSVRSTELPSAQATPACAGLTMVDHEGARVPELLLTIIGDDTAGVRLEMYFGEDRDIYLSEPGGSGDHLLSWSLDRAQGPGHWDLEESRARALELAPEAESETGNSRFGLALRMDLGERDGAEVHFEQVRRNFGADTASLHCVAPDAAEWVLTAGRARALHMFPNRVPDAALDTLDPELPLHEFNARMRLLSLSFWADRPLETSPLIAALRTSGFVDVRPSPTESTATLVNSATVVRAEVPDDGQTLTFALPTIGDAFVRGQTPAAATPADEAAVDGATTDEAADQAATDEPATDEATTD